MKFEYRIEEIKNLEILIYDTLIKTLRTSLAYDTRIRGAVWQNDGQVMLARNEKEERSMVDNFYSEIQNLLKDEEKLNNLPLVPAGSTTVEYMRQLVEFISKLEKVRSIVARPDKFNDGIAYYYATKEQNDEIFEYFTNFTNFLRTMDDMSKDPYTLVKLEDLLQYFDIIIHESPILDEDKVNQSYEEYSQRMADEKARAEQQEMMEALIKAQKREDEMFVKSVNDKFFELQTIKTKLHVIGTDRVAELVLLVEQFIAELEKEYGTFPLSPETTDFTKIMFATEDVENAKSYVNDGVTALVKCIKNAEGNFTEDLKERPNGSIRDQFDGFCKRVVAFKNKYGNISAKADYLPEEIESIARAYALTESISAELDSIRESNYFTYGIVEYKNPQ